MSKAAADISTALRLRNKFIGLTASFSKIDPRTFADNRQLSKLDTDDWQIVFGRRGAGKTTLLATYAQYITQTDRIKSASIEVNVPDFVSVVESNGTRKIKDAELAQIYFDDFVRFISNHLFEVFSTANNKSKFYRFGVKSQKMKYVEDLILKIRASTSVQEESPIGGNKKATSKRQSRSTLAKDAGVSADLSIGLKKSGAPSAEGKLQAGYGHEEKAKVTEDFQGSVTYRHFKLDYALTRQLIEELLTALGFEKLYIFLDEWSELDRTGATEIQPYFADLVKRVFWKNPKFVLKIGAIRNHTRLNSTTKMDGIIGLELAADIFELNLDSVYTESEINRIRFFEELVFRHLAVCNPELLAFQRHEEVTPYGTLHGRPVETFITHIFKSRDVFKTLVVGSGSLPRDFIEMFDSIAQNRKFSVDPLWSMADAKSAVRDHYLKNKHSSIRRDSLAMSICEKIMVAVKKNGSRLVIIQNNASNDVLLGIANLYHRRFLHDVSLSDIPPLLRNSHSFFYADLGLQFDVSREKFEDASDHNEVFPLQGDEEAKDIVKYLIQ